MSKCLTPIVLNNGEVVPCGRCDLCRSSNRTNWTVRLGIHAKYYDTMPLFITLTYNDEHLPITEHGHATINRDDVTQFIREYKRVTGQVNDDFTYFGCCEYGGKFGRPHAHLLLFGDDDLMSLFFRDSEKAERKLMNIWKHGFVHCCVADWSGIHYVTKYVLKDALNLLPDDVALPCTIASKGLGMNYLRSKDAQRIREKLDYLVKNRSKIYAECPEFSIESKASIKNALAYMERFVPRFTCMLDDGRTVALPREIRRRLVGSFEHFKDNPLWLYRTLQQLLNSIDYVENYHDYDHEHDKAHWQSLLELRVDKIRRRLNREKYNLKQFRK